jgi:uncharacterized protein (DUF1697 family)
MPRYVAFLRGMNVGGHRITNDELCDRFTAIGLREVNTFRASGNVIFLSDSQPDTELAARIESGLAESLGYGVPTFIRSEDEVKAIVAQRPFSANQLAAHAGKRQVAFLAAAPAKQAVQTVLALAGEDDALAFGERELHWLPSGGILDSPLDWREIERLTGALTMRTIGTVEQIAAKHIGS